MREEPQLVNMPGAAVLGFTIRTNNEREMSGGGRIGPLWQTFMQSGGEKIPNVSDPSLTYSIYTDYESDHTGDYSVILGKPVSRLESLPPLRGIQIPSGRYAVFHADGSDPNAIRESWRRVYGYFDGRTDVRRAFTVDYELYSPGNVALYIAVTTLESGNEK